MALYIAQVIVETAQSLKVQMAVTSQRQTNNFLALLSSPFATWEVSIITMLLLLTVVVAHTGRIC